MFKCFSSNFDLIGYLLLAGARRFATDTNPPKNPQSEIIWKQQERSGADFQGRAAASNVSTSSIESL